MGAASSASKHPPSKYLEKYLSNKNQNNNNNSDLMMINPEFLFKKYTPKDRGYLDEFEAIEFLLQIITKSGLSKIIEEGIMKKNHEKAESVNLEDVNREFVWVMLQELDPKVTNILNQEQFCQALTKDWTPIIQKSIAMGSSDRSFTKRLRDIAIKKKKEDNEKLETLNSSKTKNEKSLENSAESSGAKTKTKKATGSLPTNRLKSESAPPIKRSDENSRASPLRQPNRKKKKVKRANEAEETDAMWEYQIKQEDIEAKVEKASNDSRALTKSGIHKLRSGMITSVTEIMEIKPHVAQNLLHKVNWDKNKLLTEYFNNPEDFLKKENLDLNLIALSALQAEKPTPEDVQEEVTCSICFDDYSPDQMTTLEVCGHTFCNVCWCENLTLQISHGHTLDISCMHQGCTELVPAHIVQSIVPPEISSKYNSFLGKTFVENNKDLIWCSSPGCELALSEPISEGKILVLTCACGNRLCWYCRNEAHPPIDCGSSEKFQKEAKDEDSLKYMIENKLDAETLRWMHENTKQCPFCNVSVQKNDGCFCMTCAQCHKQWCWLCRGDWSTHPDHFSCKTYNADRSKLSDKPDYQDDESFNKRLAVEKLAKYFGQYHDQTQAMDLESNRDNQQKDEEKITELTKGMESFDITFYIQGRLTVKKCRETLKFSYVHSYYSPSQEEDHILNYLQSSLSMCIENLAQSLQKPATTISPPEVRKSTRIAMIALENLLAHICGEFIQQMTAQEAVGEVPGLEADGKPISVSAPDVIPAPVKNKKQRFTIRTKRNH